MKRIDELFNIQYGNSLDLASLSQCEKTNKNSINFVSRTAKNNGVSAIVEKIPQENPMPAGTLSVALGGSVLETFLQPKPYYSGYHVFVLTPKIPLSDEIKLFYRVCIRANKYKYNYGRQANKTLKDILLPDVSEIPEWVTDKQLPKYDSINERVSLSEYELNPTKWKQFKYTDIFNVRNGYYNKKPEHSSKGDIPFIGATRYDNGITDLYSLDDIANYEKTGTTAFDKIENKIFDENCITVVNNGASVGCAFYQDTKFTCSHDVNSLYLKNYTMNKYIAFFIIGLIEKEKYRWCYGRKWRPARMIHSTISLPIKQDGNPNYEFMETYIKSLPYSASLGSKSL
jgi:hypothetical protein